MDKKKLNKDYSVEPLPKRELQSKILMALEDQPVVACVLTEEDLRDLIRVLKAKAWSKRQRNILEGLERLQKEVFGRE